MGEAKAKRAGLKRLGEDTITGMARRAYTHFRDLEMKTGARMREWDDAPLIVRANWKDIIGQGFGTRGTLVNCNPTLTDPHTLMVTGLTDEQANGIRMGLEARLGGTVEKPAMNYSDKAFDALTEEEKAALDGRLDTTEPPEIAPPEGSA